MKFRNAFFKALILFASVVAFGFLLYLFSELIVSLVGDSVAVALMSTALILVATMAYYAKETSGN